MNRLMFVWCAECKTYMSNSVFPAFFPGWRLMEFFFSRYSLRNTNRIMKCRSFDSKEFMSLTLKIIFLYCRFHHFQILFFFFRTIYRKVMTFFRKLKHTSLSSITFYHSMGRFLKKKLIVFCGIFYILKLFSSHKVL